MLEVFQSDFEPDQLNFPHRAEAFRGNQHTFGGPITDELIAIGIEPERAARAALRSKWRFESMKDEGDAFATLDKLKGQRLPSERFTRRWLPTGKQVLNINAFFPKP